MKFLAKVVGLVLVLFFTSYMPSLHAQDITWLTPTEFEFGEMKQYQPDSFKFVFKNTSGFDIVIDNVRTTCGCTAPRWSYDPIPADSSSTVEIVYNAKNIGYFDKRIKVFFSGIRKAEILRVSGNVVE